MTLLTRTGFKVALRVTFRLTETMARSMMLPDIPARATQELQLANRRDTSQSIPRPTSQSISSSRCKENVQRQSVLLLLGEYVLKFHLAESRADSLEAELATAKQTIEEQELRLVNAHEIMAQISEGGVDEHRTTATTAGSPAAG